MLVKGAPGRSMEDYYIEKLLQIRNIPDELANVKIVGINVLLIAIYTIVCFKT